MKLYRLRKSREVVLTIHTTTDASLDWFRGLRRTVLRGRILDKGYQYFEFDFDVDQIQVIVVKPRVVKGKPKK